MADLAYYFVGCMASIVRNNKIFKNEVSGIEEIVEKIKVLSWRPK